jgi:hypothetical protein
VAELTSNINYLQPTGFAVSISKENYPNIQYFAQSVSHPSVSVSEVEAPYQRRNVPIIGDKILFDEVQFTFLVDEDMKSYEEMFAWLNRIVNDEYKTSAGTLLSGIGSEADITVTILSSHNNAKKQIRYVNAFPVNVTGIEFAATNTEISPLTFSAGFRYSYFELL